MIRSNSGGALVVVAIACSGVLVAAPARAQAPDRPADTAEAARLLYVEGKEWREKGDLQRSLERLEEAHALYATPVTALEVGRARALVGKLREAIEVLDSIDRLPLKPNESPKTKSARAEAKALLLQYRARVPKLWLDVQVGARVSVDGEIVPTDAIGAAWAVDAGTHHVEATRGEARASEDVRVAEGEERRVTLRLPNATPPPPSPRPATAVETSAPAPRVARGPNVLAYVGFGVGAAGVLAGAITGIATITRAATLRSACASGVCPPDAGLDTTLTLGTVSTVSFIVGGAGLGLGIAALLLAPDDEPPKKKAAWAEPWIGAGTLGLRGGF